MDYPRLKTLSIGTWILIASGISDFSFELYSRFHPESPRRISLHGIDYPVGTEEVMLREREKVIQLARLTDQLNFWYPW